MDWIEYKNLFVIEAEKAGYFSFEIPQLLDYAEVLFNKNLPVIYNAKHLSEVLGYNLDFLYSVSNYSSEFYYDFKIPKKNGSFRELSAPVSFLKEIQRTILTEILSKVKPSPFAKAFIKKRSIKSNAWFHLKQKLVLKIDLKDFFHSTSTGRVVNYFKSLGYAPGVAGLLGNLCTKNNCLPQGAPTSPALSNLLNLQIDQRISGFCKKHNIRYTRYADDMTFSGDFPPGMIVKFVKSVVSDYGYEINTSKTNCSTQSKRQCVTGIVVNSKMSVPREFREELRKEIYFVLKFGIESHLYNTNNYKANYLDSLLGRIAHVLYVDSKNHKMREAFEKIKSIKKNLTSA